MWKCKKCGSSHFDETIIGGYREVIFDKHGEVEETIEQDVEYGRLQCGYCDNVGESIEEIAIWEE